MDQSGLVEPVEAVAPDVIAVRSDLGLAHPHGAPAPLRGKLFRLIHDLDLLNNKLNHQILCPELTTPKSLQFQIRSRHD